MEKHKILIVMSVLFFLAALLLVQAGCDKDGGDNETLTTTTAMGDSPDGLSCVPCGDFDPSCPNCTITECPVCVSLSSEGDIKYVYGDGHYAIVEADENDPDTTTFYDSTGNQCFQWLVFENVANETRVLTYDNTGQECYQWIVDYSTNTVTWTVGGGEQYVKYAEDGRWECPDGTTWQAPLDCEDEDYEFTVVPLPGADPEICQPVTDPCDGAGFPM